MHFGRWGPYCQSSLSFCLQNCTTKPICARFVCCHFWRCVAVDKSSLTKKWRGSWSCLPRKWKSFSLMVSAFILFLVCSHLMMGVLWFTALKTRLISGKIDAAQRRFRVTTCIEPSFSKAKWLELRDGLTQWQAQVRHMKRMVASVTNPDLAWTFLLSSISRPLPMDSFCSAEMWNTSLVGRYFRDTVVP